MSDLGNWTIADVTGDTYTFWKAVSSDTGQQLVFVVTNCRMEPDWEPEGGESATFDSFTIDGRAPTDEEHDEHADDLRELIREAYSG